MASRDYNAFKGTERIIIYNVRQPCWPFTCTPTCPENDCVRVDKERPYRMGDLHNNVDPPDSMHCSSRRCDAGAERLQRKGGQGGPDGWGSDHPPKFKPKGFPVGEKTSRHHHGRSHEKLPGVPKKRRRCSNPPPDPRTAAGFPDVKNMVAEIEETMKDCNTCVEPPPSPPPKEEAKKEKLRCVPKRKKNDPCQPARGRGGGTNERMPLSPKSGGSPKSGRSPQLKKPIQFALQGNKWERLAHDQDVEGVIHSGSHCDFVGPHPPRSKYDYEPIVSSRITHRSSYEQLIPNWQPTTLVPSPNCDIDEMCRCCDDCESSSDTCSSSDCEDPCEHAYFSEYWKTVKKNEPCAVYNTVDCIFQRKPDTCHKWRRYQVRRAKEEAGETCCCVCPPPPPPCPPDKRPCVCPEVPDECIECPEVEEPPCPDQTCEKFHDKAHMADAHHRPHHHHPDDKHVHHHHSGTHLPSRPHKEFQRPGTSY